MCAWLPMAWLYVLLCKGESWHDVAQTAATAKESLSDRWTDLAGRTGLAGLTPATSAPGLTWSNAEREIFETKSAPLLNASITTCIGNGLHPLSLWGNPDLLCCLFVRSRAFMPLRSCSAQGYATDRAGLSPLYQLRARRWIGPCSLGMRRGWTTLRHAALGL